MIRRFLPSAVAGGAFCRYRAFIAAFCSRADRITLARAHYFEGDFESMPANRPEEWIEIARARMAAKGKEKPATKTGAVRALWPAIEPALKNGQTLKSVRDWLEDEGVHVTYNQLTSYAARIRRKAKRMETALPQAGESVFAPQIHISNAESSGRVEAKPPKLTLKKDDPLANVRSRETKRPTFEYNPEFKEDELI